MSINVTLGLYSFVNRTLFGPPFGEFAVVDFQRAIDEVRTLLLTPERVAQKANLSFRNRFPYISVIDEANDFKYGMQLGLPKAHHQIPLEEKVDVALG